MHEVIYEEVFQSVLFKISKIIEGKNLPPKYKVSTEDNELSTPDEQGNSFVLEFKRWTICDKQKEAWSVLSDLKKEHTPPKVNKD